MNIFDKVYDIPEFEDFSGMAVLKGTDKFGEAFKMPLPHANTLFVGTTGSGKSTQIEKMIEQTVNEKDSVHVIFDPKGDFYKKFYRKGTDYVISLFDLPETQSVGWNIFKDISLSSHPETAVRELAGAIFEEAIKNNSSSPFFPQAAKSIVISTWLMLYRRYKNGNLPDNYTLINKTKEFTYDQLKAESKNKRNADLRGDIELISPKSPKTAASVKSEQIEALQAFNPEGNFCRKNGDFSVIDFIRHGQGKRLFLVYDFATCYSCRQIFGILINLMLKESLAIKSIKPDYNTYFYLDEVPILPDNIFNLKSAVNFGRSNKVYIVFGAQSLSQIYETYGEFGGNSILSGFNNSIIMKANDSLSISKLAERSGEITRVVSRMGITRNSITSANESTYKIPPESLAQLDTGEAIVSLRGKDPFYIHFDR